MGSRDGGRKAGRLSCRLEAMFGVRGVAAFLSVVIVFVTMAVVSASRAQTTDDFLPFTSDWGGVGLLQTRSARFDADGQFTMGASYADPWQRYFFTIQALPWLEGTFRYTIATDDRLIQLRGGIAQTFLDRGADLKFKIFNEGRYIPAVAVGFQDLLGTGQFDSEYFVVSKRYYNFDFSLGLAWGYLGQRGQLRNPFTFISKRLETRGEGFAAQGGEVEFGKFFTGERVGIFGGIQYRTPWHGIWLTAEIDGNNYTNEPTSTETFEVGSAFNVGISYRPWPWITSTVALERGNTLMFRLTIGSNLNSLVGVPKIEEPPPAVVSRSSQTAELAGTSYPSATTMNGSIDSVDRLFRLFEAQGLEVQELDLVQGEMRIVVVDMPPSRRLPGFWAELAYHSALALPMPAAWLTIIGRYPGYDELKITATTDELVQAGALSTGGISAILGGSPNETVASLSANEAGRTADALFEGVEAEGFSIEAVEITRNEAVLYVSQRMYRQLPRAIGRIARIAANTLPASVEAITVVTLDSGLPTTRTTILRQDLESAEAGIVDTSEIWYRATFESPDVIPDTAMFNPGRYPGFSWKLGPKLRQHVGRPGEFYRFQIWLALSGQVELARGLTLNGMLGADLYNDFDKIPSIPASSLPNVRSKVVDYLQEGANNLVNLAAHYVFQPAQSWYGRVSGGIFEEMYMGGSGEILYRPFASPWAISLEINQVWQREFKQRFGLLEDDLAYDVVTGHLSTYYQLPAYNLLGTVHIGRYLAGDDGFMLELVRQFESGIRFGAWATFTDVSSAEFGEGSFDKGFFISIPYELFFTTSSRSVGTFAFRPLTRDGGQRVNVSKRLYGITGDADVGRLADDWRFLLD